MSTFCSDDFLILILVLEILSGSVKARSSGASS